MGSHRIHSASARARRRPPHASSPRTPKPRYAYWMPDPNRRSSPCPSTDNPIRDHSPGSTVARCADHHCCNKNVVNSGSSGGIDVRPQSASRLIDGSPGIQSTRTRAEIDRAPRCRRHTRAIHVLASDSSAAAGPRSVPAPTPYPAWRRTLALQPLPQLPRRRHPRVDRLGIERHVVGERAHRQPSLRQRRQRHVPSPARAPPRP